MQNEEKYLNANAEKKVLELDIEKFKNTELNVILLHSEIGESKKIVKIKNEEILQLKSSLGKIEMENKSLSLKLNSLLNDKQLLEKEIRGMQDEFGSICLKLDQLQDKDHIVRNLKEENALINSSINEKSHENASLQSQNHMLKMDLERIQRNYDILNSKYSENTKRVENLNNELLNISVDHRNSFSKSLENNGAVNSLRTSNERLMGDIQVYTLEIKTLTKSLEESETKLIEKYKTIQMHDQQINELKSMLLEYENLNSKVESKLQSISRSELQNEKTNDELRNKILSLEKENKEIQIRYSEL